MMDCHNGQVKLESARTYQTDASARRFMKSVGMLLVVFFLAMTPVHLLGLMRHPIPPLQLALVDAGVIVFAIWMFAAADRRVVVHENAIEVAGWFSTCRLNRNEILGRRMGRVPKRAGGSSFYIIVPVDSRRPELKLPPLLHVDRYFDSWIAKIPEITSPR
jgi:hypothetical protein